MTRYMNEQRLQQIQDVIYFTDARIIIALRFLFLQKIKRRQELNGQENNFLAEWNRQLETLARKDKEKQDLKHKIDMETNEEVKAQIQFNFRYASSSWRYLCMYAVDKMMCSFDVLTGLGKSTCWRRIRKRYGINIVAIHSSCIRTIYLRW